MEAKQFSSEIVSFTRGSVQKKVNHFLGRSSIGSTCTGFSVGNVILFIYTRPLAGQVPVLRFPEVTFLPGRGSPTSSSSDVR